MTVPMRPAYCTDDHLTYLDELRDSGITNMFGSSPYLRQEFDDLSEEQSHLVVAYWVNSRQP